MPRITTKTARRFSYRGDFTFTFNSADGKKLSDVDLNTVHQMLASAIAETLEDASLGLEFDSVTTEDEPRELVLREVPLSKKET